MRHLGIDYGTKYVGTALSDEDGKMGFPHKVFINTSSLLETFAQLVEKEGVGLVVFGESKDLDGTDNPLQEEVRAFAKLLHEKTGVENVFEPEYYTTRQARDAHKLAGKTSDRADAVAAAIILTSYLERYGND